MSVQRKQDGWRPGTAQDLETMYHFKQRFRELKMLLDLIESGKLDMKVIRGLLPPETDSDAANKKYVDDGLEKKAPMSHVGAKDNPHGVTANQVGAAPAGYGLGAGGKAIASGDNLNNYKVGGFYQFTSGVANAPTNYGMMLVIPGTGYLNDTFQYVFSRYPTNNMAIRQLFEGTWGAWEWVNPPMELGKEYRTTERYNGKPVYVKVASLGALTANTAKAVAYSSDANCRAIRVGGGVTNGMAVQTGLISAVSNGAVSNGSAIAYFGSYCNYVTVKYPHTVSNVDVTVAYYKTTD